MFSAAAETSSNCVGSRPKGHSGDWPSTEPNLELKAPAAALHVWQVLRGGTWCSAKPVETPNPQSYPGHEEESIERLKIVNSMKEKIQQAFGVWLVCLFQSQHVQADFTKMQNGVWN